MRATITILFSLLLFVANSQEHFGYYGKRNFLEVVSVSYVPIIENLYSNTGGFEALSNGTLTTKSKDYFNTGIRASVGRATRQNFAVSFETGIDYWQMRFYGTSAMDQHENLKMYTLNFMPKLHFSNKNSLLPMGLHHEVGVGYTLSRVKKKEYTYRLGFTGEYVTSSLDDSYYLDFGQNYNTLQIMYNLSMHQPISKTFLLVYGLRYTADIPLPVTGTLLSINSDKYSSTQDINYSNRSHHFKNFLSLDLGICYTF